MIEVRKKIRDIGTRWVGIFLMQVASLVGGKIKGARKPLKEASKILVIRLDGIGDVVMTTPFLRELRRNYPDAEITLVVASQVKNLVERCPYVNTVIGFNYSTRFPVKQVSLFFRALKWVKLYLNNSNYDLVFSPRWDYEAHGANFIAKMCKSADQVAYTELATKLKVSKSKGTDRFYSQVLRDDLNIHEIDHNLNMLRQCGLCVKDDKVELWGDGDAEQSVEQLLVPLLGADGIIAVCPGALQPVKIWPAERYIEVIRFVLEHTNMAIVVVGGPAEKDLGESVISSFQQRVLNLAGKTTLCETEAVLKRCALFIGNDTGVVHIASAVGTPQVMLCCFSENGDARELNSPARFAPRNKTIVLQPKASLAPCSGGCISTKAHCIKDISVDKVTSFVMEALSRREDRGVL